MRAPVVVIDAGRAYYAQYRAFTKKDPRAARTAYQASAALSAEEVEQLRVTPAGEVPAWAA